MVDWETVIASVLIGAMVGIAIGIISNYLTYFTFIDPWLHAQGERAIITNISLENEELKVMVENIGLYPLIDLNIMAQIRCTDGYENNYTKDINLRQGGTNMISFYDDHLSNYHLRIFPVDMSSSSLVNCNITEYISEECEKLETNVNYSIPREYGYLYVEIIESYSMSCDINILIYKFDSKIYHRKMGIEKINYTEYPIIMKKEDNGSCSTIPPIPPMLCKTYNTSTGTSWIP